ncbi:MAG: hypothetical protein GY874_09310 [Desulfobacteraceae bacterium]|nr:hypothetical protein [Desulfobacteraceae bacterium]
MDKIKRKRKKQTRHIGYAKLFKNSLPQIVIEKLPECKNELERAIVDKFISALAHYYNRIIEDIEKIDDRPDFIGKEGGDTIFIEITELANEKQHELFFGIRKKYETAIIDGISDILTNFNGLHIGLDDQYQKTLYPRSNSKKGKIIVKTFIDNIIRHADELVNLKNRHFKFYEWQNEDGKPYIGIYVYRIAPKNSRIPAQICFPEHFPEPVDTVHSLLTKTIQKKIEKNYKESPLILLIYEASNMSVFGYPDAINKAQDLLKKENHPFQEVWYIYLLPIGSISPLLKIYPDAEAE